MCRKGFDSLGDHNYDAPAHRGDFCACIIVEAIQIRRDLHIRLLLCGGVYSCCVTSPLGITDTIFDDTLGF